jgi:uncharacterized Ntn-hydrolase superfamily protein
MDRVAAGMDAPSALSEAITFAVYPEWLMMGVAALNSSSPTGVSVATYLGSALAAEFTETCQLLRATYTVNADLQTSAEVCQVMAQAFEATEGQQLARRLYAALVAGSAVGGDKRGEYDAAVKVWSNWWFDYASLLSVTAEVRQRVHWAPALEFSLEAYLAYFQWGDPREQIPFTDHMIKEVLLTLQSLGYYRHGPMDKWTGDAEKAFEAWGLRQLEGIRTPTWMNGGTRMIERSNAYLLMNGERFDYLIPASPDVK